MSLQFLVRHLTIRFDYFFVGLFLLAHFDRKIIGIAALERTLELLQARAVAADDMIYVVAIIEDLGALLLVEHSLFGLLLDSTTRLSLARLRFLVGLLLDLLWLIAIVFFLCLVVGFYWRQLLTHLLKDFSVLRRLLEHFEARQRAVITVRLLPFPGWFDAFFDAQVLEPELIEGRTHILIHYIDIQLLLALRTFTMIAASHVPVIIDTFTAEDHLAVGAFFRLNG